jgi:hypothetical protein
MKVRRITIDADLGIIELKTGPGGDGDYVLLPIVMPEDWKRYLVFDEIAKAEPAPNGFTIVHSEEPQSPAFMVPRGGIKYPARKEVPDYEEVGYIAPCCDGKCGAHREEEMGQ